MSGDGAGIIIGGVLLLGALPYIVGGALAVGAARNGGQEAAVQALHSFMLHEGMILAGSGRAGGGAFLWNHDDSIDDDTAGLGLARSLGERVARLAQIVPAEIFD